VLLRLPAEAAAEEAQEEVSVPTEETPALAEEAPVEAEQDEVSVPAEETPALAEEAPAEAEQEVSVPAEETPALAEEAPAEAEQEEVSVPAHDNEYLQESHRLAKLAEKSFSEGDYDASTKYADEAAWFAKKSDVYVAITTAKSYLDRAVSSGVSVQFSPEYREAENWYRQSLNASESEEWDIAIAAANMVVELLEGLDASDSVTTSVPLPALPAAYTVRPWSVSKDCFWNIAGFPWVYGNPRQWRVLYNANKSKLPNPNNPNILEPGTVLDIPSIKGELREGEWDSARSYEPLK
jgi:nucleoid-associated protein YgaU